MNFDYYAEPSAKDAKPDPVDWLSENLVKPAIDAAVEKPVESLRNLIGTTSKNATTDSAPKSQATPIDGYVQSLAHAAGAIMPYMLAGKVAGTAMGTLGTVIGSRGAASRFLCSEGVAMFTGAVAYDAMRNPVEGETRIGNATSGASAFAAFGVGNSLSAGLSGMQRLLARGLVGVAGSELQLGVSSLITGTEIDAEARSEAALHGAVINLALPALSHQFGRAVTAVNLKLGRSVSAASFAEFHGLTGKSPTLDHELAQNPLARVKITNSNAAEANLDKNSLTVRAKSLASDLGHELNHLRTKTHTANQYNEAQKLLNSGQVNASRNLFMDTRWTAENEATATGVRIERELGLNPKQLRHDTQNPLYRETFENEWRQFEQSSGRSRPSIEHRIEGFTDEEVSLAGEIKSSRYKHPDTGVEVTETERYVDGNRVQVVREFDNKLGKGERVVQMWFGNHTELKNVDSDFMIIGANGQHKVIDTMSHQPWQVYFPNGDIFDSLPQGRLQFRDRQGRMLASERSDGVHEELRNGRLTVIPDRRGYWFERAAIITPKKIGDVDVLEFMFSARWSDEHTKTISFYSRQGMDIREEDHYGVKRPDKTIWEVTRHSDKSKFNLNSPVDAQVDLLEWTVTKKENGELSRLQRIQVEGRSTMLPVQVTRYPDGTHRRIYQDPGDGKVTIDELINADTHVWVARTPDRIVTPETPGTWTVRLLDGQEITRDTDGKVTSSLLGYTQLGEDNTFLRTRRDRVTEPDGTKTDLLKYWDGTGQYVEYANGKNWWAQNGAFEKFTMNSPGPWSVELPGYTVSKDASGTLKYSAPKGTFADSLYPDGAQVTAVSFHAGDAFTVHYDKRSEFYPSLMFKPGEPSQRKAK